MNKKHPNSPIRSALAVKLTKSKTMLWLKSLLMIKPLTWPIWWKGENCYTEACHAYWHQDEQNQVHFPAGQWTYQAAKLHLSEVQERKTAIWDSLTFTVTGPESYWISSDTFGEKTSQTCGNTQDILQDVFKEWWKIEILKCGKKSVKCHFHKVNYRWIT